MKIKSIKQQRFCQEYIIDFNGTQAAIRAGFSSNCAGEIAYEYLRKPQIKHYIRELLSKTENKLGLTSERILAEMMILSFYDPIDLFDENGNLLDIKDIPEDVRKAIASIDVITDKDNNTVKKIKLYPKDKALEMLGRHKSLFNDKLNMDGLQIIIKNQTDDDFNQETLKDDE